MAQNRVLGEDRDDLQPPPTPPSGKGITGRPGWPVPGPEGRQSQGGSGTASSGAISSRTAAQPCPHTRQSQRVTATPSRAAVTWIQFRSHPRESLVPAAKLSKAAGATRGVPVEQGASPEHEDGPSLAPALPQLPSAGGGRGENRGGHRTSPPAAVRHTAALPAASVRSQPRQRRPRHKPHRAPCSGTHTVTLDQWLVVLDHAEP